jgi:predicted acyl esterase
VDSRAGQRRRQLRPVPGPEHPRPDDASFNHLPLLDADIALTGAPIPFYRERLRYDGADPHWAPLNFSSLLSETDLPVLLIAGWYDFHRRYMWQDHLRLRSRPHAARTRCGPP